MHGYWFNEAVRSFRDATKADADCPGAWIGLHIELTFPWFATDDNKPEADYALRRAQALAPQASEAERALIAAFAARASGKPSADVDFTRLMTEAVKVGDAAKTDEPRLVWAGITVQTCMARGYDEQGNRIGSMQDVLALVDPVLAREPDNAAALHYRVHALESREPEKALDAARRLGRAAPGIPHLLHMPGHIYYRLGLYKDADDAFSSGRRAEEAYFARAKKAGVRGLSTTWNYGHNLSFLVLNLAETGRYKAAAEATNAGAGSYGYTMTDWRAGRFAAIAARNKGRSDSDPYNLFFAGMAEAGRGDTVAATKTLRALQAASGAARNDASVGLTYQRTYDTMALELQGSVESAQNRHDAAIKTLRVAVRSQAEIAYDEPPYYIRPVQESLALACVRAGRYADAIAACDDELKVRPHSGYALFNRAQALQKAGRTPEARAAYVTFLDAWTTADADAPQMREARRFLSTGRATAQAPIHLTNAAR